MNYKVFVQVRQALQNLVHYELDVWLRHRFVQVALNEIVERTHVLAHDAEGLVVLVVLLLRGLKENIRDLIHRQSYLHYVLMVEVGEELDFSDSWDLHALLFLDGRKLLDNNNLVLFLCLSLGSLVFAIEPREGVDLLFTLHLDANVNFGIGSSRQPSLLQVLLIYELALHNFV